MTVKVSCHHPLDGQGACHKDLYYPMSDENTAELKDTDAEFRRLKADFLRIARNRRRRWLSRSDSSRTLRRSDVSLNDVQLICRNSR